MRGGGGSGKETEREREIKNKKLVIVKENVTLLLSGKFQSSLQSNTFHKEAIST